MACVKQPPTLKAHFMLFTDWLLKGGFTVCCFTFECIVLFCMFTKYTCSEKNFQMLALLIYVYLFNKVWYAVNDLRAILYFLLKLCL